MRNDVDAVAVRPNTKDLPSKNRVWGFRIPARYRIRKAAAQAAESRRENAPTPTNIASGIRYFLLTDQVGTLRAVADSTGMIVKRVDYDSFGNIIADSNPSFSVPFGFAGGLHDRDTGLVRFGYRDYSPELGRFVAKDPIDFAGGDANLYAYVSNDPVNLTDPIGLWVWQFNGGFHNLIMPGAALGGSFSSEIRDGRLVGKGGQAETVWGEIADVGVSVGVGDISNTGGACAGNTASFSYYPFSGKYGSVQVTFRNDFDWNRPRTWLPDAVSIGIGAGLALPFTYTVPE